jgi:hypothetical protein
VFLVVQFPLLARTKTISRDLLQLLQRNTAIAYALQNRPLPSTSTKFHVYFSKSIASFDPVTLSLSVQSNGPRRQ